MAKNFIKNVAAVIIMAGAMMLSSCTKDGRVDEHEQMENDGNIMVSITPRKGPQEDTTFTVVSRYERFVGNDTEFVVELKHNGTETYRERAGQALEGIDPQFFHEADSSLVTKSGNAERTVGTVEIPVQREGKPFATWVFEVETSVSDYMVENKSDLKFNHALTEKRVISAKFVYDADIKGTKKAEAVFDVPSREAKEGQLQIEEVTGVMHEGKTYEAFKYAYQRVVNYTIAPEYKIAGETSELTLEATNVAYLLKHEVTTVLENIKYEGDFVQEGREVKTKIERVSFDQVTYDNDEVIEKLPFDLPMNLSYRLPKMDDVWVGKEEDLYNEKVEVKVNDLSETTGKTDGAYTERIFSGVDQVSVQEGTFEVPVEYSYWTGNKEIELYALLNEGSRKNIVLTAEKNIYESTDEVDVVDVTMKANLLISFVGIGRKDESVKPETSWKRMYRIPEDWSKIYKQVDYILNLQKDETESKVSRISAKDNTNRVRVIRRNRGVPKDSVEVDYVLGLEDQLSVVSDTLVVNSVEAAMKDLKVSQTEERANTKSWSEKDADGYAKEETKDGQNIRLSNGQVVKHDFSFEKLYQNGKLVYDHAEVLDAAVSGFSIKKGKIDTLKTEDASLVIVGDYWLENTPNVTSTKAQTKAGGNVSAPSHSLHLYMMEVKGDEYIPGKDEKIFWTEKNANGGIDLCGELYEWNTVRGKKLADESRVTIVPSLVGNDGEAVEVENADGYEQSGTGHTGTGKGSYTTFAKKGDHKVAYVFDYEVPGEYVMNLKGVKGPGASHTFKPEFKIEDEKLTSGAARTEGSYTVNPKTTNVKGVYSVEGATVDITASATRNFLVKTPDEITGKRTTVEYKANGESVDYTAYLYETSRDKGEYLKDSKSGNVPFTFVGGSEADVVVNSVSNMSQSGNGRTGSGKGTYTNYINDGSQNHAQNFTFDAPASFDVVLQGTKGPETVNIPVSFKIADTGLTAGTQSVSGEYYVYPYASNAKGTLTVGTVSVSKDAQSTRNFKVVRNIPKIIPEEWGKITFAGFSAVPAHLVNNQDGFVNGNVADGNGAQTAASCLTIVTENGAVPVIFGWADQEPRVPSTSQILNSTFTEGNYTGYNSGWYNGKVWVPAMAADSGQGIGYSIPSQSNIRFVRNESLVMWGWRSGNYSTKLSGYTTSVNDGTLTITYNGQIVLEIR